ncbi:MAG: YbaB/EbfC family nucleoid-associated protein [Spirochaetales bacterium]|nr:YbaB/EbfC family nucleoid-associated protein [Spirochaetales bacterium]
MNPLDLLKNLKEVQQSIGNMQEKMKNILVTGTAGGDMVKIEMNGAFEIQKVSISPEVVDPKDTEMLEDLITAAFTQAMGKIKDKMKETISPLAGNMDIPPGFMGT